MPKKEDDNLDSAPRIFLDQWASIAAYEGGIRAASEATGIPLDIYEHGVRGQNLTARENVNAYLKFIDYLDVHPAPELEIIDRLFLNLSDYQIEQLINLCEEEDGPALQAMIKAFEDDGEDIGAKDSEFWEWFRETFYPKEAAA